MEATARDRICAHAVVTRSPRPPFSGGGARGRAGPEGRGLREGRGRVR